MKLLECYYQMKKKALCAELRAQIVQLQHELNIMNGNYTARFLALSDWISKHERECNTAEIHQVHQEIGEHLAKHATVESLHLQTKPIEIESRGDSNTGQIKDIWRGFHY